jgi:hypothetical protein
MVDHLTRVTADSSAPQAEALAGALAALGFTVRREHRQVVGDSRTVGGREAKELLRARGFADREYRIHLEYVRQWGFL